MSCSMTIPPVNDFLNLKYDYFDINLYDYFRFFYLKYDYLKKILTKSSSILNKLL